MQTVINIDNMQYTLKGINVSKTLQQQSRLYTTVVRKFLYEAGIDFEKDVKDRMTNEDRTLASKIYHPSP
ncbi:MAG: hypothetical protein ACI9CD_001262 [Candidatus Deianiraeaceae bacterium]|jgi:hypothetical protein